MFGGVGMTTIEKAEFAALAVAAVTFCFLTIYFSAKLRRERRKLNKRIKTLEKELRYDHLTGALSKKAFAEEVESSIAECGEGTLLLFDINSFRSVNDMFGHVAGDALIKRYAAKLLKEFSKELVGRLGGDEFLVYISGKCSREEINARLKKSGAVRFSDKPTQLLITSCCGAAAAPQNGKTFDDLFAGADKALYHSKTNDNTISYCKEE